MKKLLIPIFLFVCFAFAVSASTINTLNQDISMCASSPDIADVLTIINTDSIAKHYEISLSGSAAQFSTLSETSFMVEPKSSKDVFLYVRSSPEAKGNYNLNIDINSQVIKKNIEIIRCQNLQVVPKIWAYDTAPCTALTYEFEIYNNGQYSETYNIETSSKYAVLSHNPAIINPQESQTVFVYVTSPCEVFGNQDFAVKITAQKSQYYAAFPLKLNIKPLYNYSISSQELYDVCLQDSQIPITLSNKVNMQNAYKLTLKAPKWITLDKKYPILDPNQEGTIFLNIKDPKEGLYNVTVNAESLRGKLLLEKTFSVNVRKCHELEIEIPGEKDTLCQGAVKRYEIKVLNNGESQETVNLSLNAPEWVTLSEQSVNILANDSQSIIIIASAPDNETTKNNIEITAQVSNIKKTKTIQIQTITGKQCTALTFDAPKNIQLNNLQQTLEIPITNRGASEDTFTINIDAPEFVAQNSYSITLTPQETGNIELEINPANQTNFDILIQAAGEKGQAYSEVFHIKIGESIFLEFLKIYLLYIIVGIAIILIISGILKIKEIKNKN